MRCVGVLGAWCVAGLLVVSVGEAANRPVGLYGGHAQTVKNQRMAYLDASRLLAELRLPVTATRSREIPPSKLHELEGADNHADAAEVWAVPGTIRSSLGYVRGHAPVGSTIFASGYDDRPGKPDYDRWVEFAWPSVGDALADRHLYVSVTTVGRGRTSVFAQAESIWVSARPADERIPVATRSVDVRITQAGRPLRTLTVSRRREVDRIVELVNATQIVQPDEFNCGVTLSPRAFEYEFRGEHDRTLARVTYTSTAGTGPGPCNPMTVNIRGHRRDDLLGGLQMVDVQRLLGLKTIG